MSAVQRKTCPDCKQDKDVAEFGLNRRNADGLAAYCKPCFRLRHNAGYVRRREAAGHTVRPQERLPEGLKRCASCRDVKPVTDFHRARSQSGGYVIYCKPCRREISRETHLRRTYGLDSATLGALIDRQGGSCAVCGVAPAVHVDHDHLTGRVRGVLCFNCNGGLGQFKDRVDVLRQAIDYLERTTWQRTQICTGVYRLTSPRLAARRSPSSSGLQLLISSRRAASCPPA